MAGVHEVHRALLILNTVDFKHSKMHAFLKFTALNAQEDASTRCACRYLKESQLYTGKTPYHPYAPMTLPRRDISL